MTQYDPPVFREVQRRLIWNTLWLAITESISPHLNFPRKNFFNKFGMRLQLSVKREVSSNISVIWMHFKMTTCRSTRLYILTEIKMRVERMDTVMLIKSQAAKLGDPNLKTEMNSIWVICRGFGLLTLAKFGWNRLVSYLIVTSVSATDTVVKLRGHSEYEYGDQCHQHQNDHILDGII